MKLLQKTGIHAIFNRLEMVYVTNCNNAYCLYDGGDCLNGGDIFEAIRMVNGRIMMKMVGSSSTEAFSPLQQGDELFENPILQYK